MPANCAELALKAPIAIPVVLAAGVPVGVALADRTPSR